LSALVLLGSLALAQAPEHSKSIPHKRVTLETVLSCATDSVLDEVFKTDAFTARIMLNTLGMVVSQRKSDPKYMPLLAKGFEAQILDDSRLAIMPSDHLGHLVDVSDKPFCHDFPTAEYEKSEDKNAGPYLIEINGGDWLLNPDEVFIHADQFQFSSGVFSNSSDVFLTAKKGRVSIQFVCKPDGLKFYRAIYTPQN
jgi:hypothetical protein